MIAGLYAVELDPRFVLESGYKLLLLSGLLPKYAQGFL